MLNAGDAIERLAEVDTVVFDKTGTLTLPEPRVVNAAAIDADLLRAGGAARAVEPPSARGRAVARGARRARRSTARRGAGPGRARHDRRQSRRGSAARRSAASTRRRSDATIRRPRSSRSRTATARPCSRSARRCARMRSRSSTALRAARARHASSCRAIAREAVAPIAARARHRQLAGGAEAGREDRAHRGAEGAGPPRADGRRRPQRRARARGRACLDVADRRRRIVTQAQADAVFLGERLTPVLDAVVIARARAAADERRICGSR